MDEWKDDIHPDVAILDEWFKSDIYKEVIRDANVGDKDSVELLARFDSHLEAASFHMDNGSPRPRVDYELRQMADCVRDLLK